MYIFTARKCAHSELYNQFRHKEDGQTDPQDGIFFDRNRLKLFGMLYVIEKFHDVSGLSISIRKSIILLQGRDLTVFTKY